MSRDTVRLEDTISTISKEYLLEFILEYGIPESLHPELPGPEEPIVEFSEGKVGVYTKFFKFANYHERIFPTVVEWRTNAPQDKMPSADSYSGADVTTLNTHRTPIQKQPEALLCLVRLSRSYFLGDDVYLTFLYDDDRDMDLFNLISASNPTKVKTGTRPHAAHKVPLLTATTSCVIDMEDTVDGLSHGIPFVENVATTEVVLEPGLEKEVAAMGPRVNKRRHKRGNDEAEANAPPKVLRKDHAAFRLAQSTLKGKSLAPLGLDAGSSFAMPVTQHAPTVAKSVSDPDPLSYAKPQPHPELDIAPCRSFRKTTIEVPIRNVATTEVQGPFSTESPESGKSTSFPFMDGSPGAQQVAMGSQLRLRFEQEVRLLKKATNKIAKRDQRIQAREEEIERLDQEIKSLRVVEAKVHGLRNQTKNLETLLEAKVDMKKAAEAKNVKLAKELENLRRCVKMDARLDKLSVDFDEELCMSEGLKHGIKHEKVDRDLAAVEAYDPEADSKYVKALQDLKDLKYPLVDQLERLKDAPIELIMASLYLESDSEEDAPQLIRDLRFSSSQLKIPMYPEVCDLEDHWVCKEEMLLDDVIAENKSRAEKRRSAG
nr:hypothetical protein [Tanacetum cinerariifolium]